MSGGDLLPPTGEWHLYKQSTKDMAQTHLFIPQFTGSLPAGTDTQH